MDPLAYFVKPYVPPLRRVGIEQPSLWMGVRRDHHSLHPFTIFIMMDHLRAVNRAAQSMGSPI